MDGSLLFAAPLSLPEPSWTNPCEHIPEALKTGPINVCSRQGTNEKRIAVYSCQRWGNTPAGTHLGILRVFFLSSMLIFACSGDKLLLQRANFVSISGSWEVSLFYDCSLHFAIYLLTFYPILPLIWSTYALLVADKRHKLVRKKLVLQ